ncbi:MAG: MFS transporter [Dehalococcoidia bacterium]|nr:MFS transporter [Dehalococcoidia bacterium]
MNNGISGNRYPGGRPRADGGFRTFSALKNYNYRLLWLGSLGHSSGMWMDQIARSWLIWELTGSPAMLGLVNAARGLPMLFFGIWGGVAADRFDRQKILLACQIVTWLSYLDMAVLITIGQIQVWHIFLNAVVMGTAMSFNMPTRQSMIPSVVPPEMLGNAIGLNVMAMNSTRVLGPTVAGVMIPMLGTGGVYLLSSVIYTGVVVSTFMLHLPPFISGVRTRSAWGDLKDGFRYMGDTPIIMLILALGLLPILLGMPYMTLLPVFADEVLNIGATGFGVLTSIAGFGGLVGAILIASVTFQREGRAMLISTFGFGVCILALGVFPLMFVVPPLLFLIGMTNSFFQALTQTSLIRIAPEAMRGRIMGIRMLDMGLAPIGSSFAGFLAQLASVPAAFMVMGSSCAVLAVVAGFANRSIRELNVSDHSAQPVETKEDILVPSAAARSSDQADSMLSHAIR